MRRLPRPREYIAMHGYETVLVSLLLGYDLNWLLLEEKPVLLFLSAAVMWSLFMICTTNGRNPNELVMCWGTFGWVVGNGFWTVFDLADVGEHILLGERISPEARRCLLLACGVCFGASFGLGTLYYLHLRWTDRFATARAATGDSVALARLYREEGSTGYGSISAKGSPEGGRSRSLTPNHLMPFDGPAFLPNVFRVKSWVEYEGVALFLWICKDLSWWLAVEMNVPGMDIVMCVVAGMLVLHHVDMLVTAAINDDVMGLANLITLLFWVTSMCIWAVGDYYQTDDVLAVVPPLSRPEHPENMRFAATWIMLCGAGFFGMFWTAYLGMFAVYDDDELSPSLL
uniref:Uncharacterized protein n=1 Tax=Mantoniella antarctica TaxID=81844 RepID=A0A7S0SD04_9CHLO|mmetsp:Transcript_18795/g.46669  ORF Transcript_18795/g.46669 Transcript_18795/m.46669 type:complete len:343 (+) Transcript_18795:222-1250(+)